MKDRIVEHPNRYRFVPVFGEDDVFDLIPEPGEVTQEGTPLNAPNLLSRDTGAMLGYGSFDDPTVNDAFAKLADGKAPKNHRSTATTYGVGNDTQYGHLKLGDSTELESGVDGGIAATPLLVKTAIEEAAPKYKLIPFAGRSNLLSSGGSVYIPKKEHNFKTLVSVVLTGKDCLAVLESAQLRYDLNYDLEILFTTYNVRHGYTPNSIFNAKVYGIAIGI